MTKLNISIIIYLLILSFNLGQSRTVILPSVSLPDIVYLRTEQVLKMDSAFNVFGNLNQITKKEIYQIKDGKQSTFAMCQQVSPESIFTSYSYHEIQSTIVKNKLVYNFEDIQFPRNLIDMALYSNTLLYVLSKGTLEIVTISPNLHSIKAIKSLNISTSRLSSGFITILPKAQSDNHVGYAVYVHETFVVLVDLDNNQIRQIKQYEKRNKVESVVALEGNMFAVAYGNEGMRIFQINFSDSTLRVVYDYNIQKNATVDIKDIAYHKSKRLLFILDYKTGLIPLQLSFTNSLALQVSSTSSITRLNFCNLLYFNPYSQELYVNCRQLHQYKISKWPLYQQKTLPQLEISIRQIMSTSKLTALIGRDIFQIIYSERKTAVYQDQLLDKFIITDDRFVSGNQNGILVGNYTLKPPSLVCSSQNTTNLGSHKLVMKATAECNEEYFKQIGFITSSTTPQDKCIYTVYQNLNIWTPARLNTDTYFLIAIIIGLIGFSVLIWWGFSYLNLRKLQLYLQNYHNLAEQNGSEREQNNKSIDIKDKSINKDISGGTGEVLKQKEDIEMQNDNIHDIQ